MNKFDPYIEDVRGIVIGDITKTYALHTPDGKFYTQASELSNMDEARQWALDIINSVRLDLGPVESNRLGYDKQWELREYN